LLRLWYKKNKFIVHMMIIEGDEMKARKKEMRVKGEHSNRARSARESVEEQTTSIQRIEAKRKSRPCTYTL